MPSGHVLIGGGTGFVGTALRYLLKGKGYEVSVVSRMPGPKNITWLELDSKGLPEGITAVINLAGQNILDPFQRWTPGFKQNVWNSRVNTTSTLAKAIKAANKKPDVFLTISGVGIYNPDCNEEYTEDSNVSKTFDFLSELAVAWEKASQLPPDCNVRVANIRSGVVLGRQGGMIQQLYIPFFFGAGGPIGSGKQPLPWIHIKDLCNMFLFGLEENKFVGPVNGVAPEIVSNEDFSKAFASAMHRPAFFRTPEFLLNILFSAERAKIMTAGQKVIPARAKALGFKYEFPDIKSASRDCAKLLYSKKKPL